jgi:hypothetical protein
VLGRSVHLHVDRHNSVAELRRGRSGRALLQGIHGNCVGLVVLLLGGSGCSHIMVVDYVFGAEGVVSDTTGAPLEGVSVTLTLGSEEVYAAIEPIRNRTLTTDSQGRFQFMYLTGNRATPYSLCFEKEGYLSQSVSGVSPPYQKHVVQLIRAPASHSGERMLSNDRLKRAAAKGKPVGAAA